MVVESKIQLIYKEIQKQLYYMIPEKWDKVYLYSSIIERNNIQTGELYFYYIPRGILKKKPVNVYEVPKKFNIDESEYLKLVDNLYLFIKQLQKECIENLEEKWDSIIISIADFKFNVEYIYNNKFYSMFNSYEKHIVFLYKYLGYSISSFPKKDKQILYQYINKAKTQKLKTKEYSEAIYELPYEIIALNEINRNNIKYIKEEEKNNTEEKEIKSQILKSSY